MNNQLSIRRRLSVILIVTALAGAPVPAISQSGEFSFSAPPAASGGGCPFCDGAQPEQLGCMQKGGIAVGNGDSDTALFSGATFSFGYAPNATQTACVQSTQITLISFTSTPGEGRVTLIWTTGAEIKNYGFNLLRSASPDGPFERINPTVIPAMGISPGGATYTFVDTAVFGETTYYYRLEDIDVHGVITAHNTVSATPLVASRSSSGDSSEIVSTRSPATSRPAASSGASFGGAGVQPVVYHIVTSGGSELSVARLEAGARRGEQVTQKAFGLTAKAKEGQVVLEWTARNEDDGYYLWRSEEDTGEAYTQLTDFLLPAFDMDRPNQGLKFAYTDASAVPAVSYFYKLEAIDPTGKSRFVAKASAVAPRAQGVSEESTNEQEMPDGEKKVDPRGSPENGEQDTEVREPEGK